MRTSAVLVIVVAGCTSTVSAPDVGDAGTDDAGTDAHVDEAGTDAHDDDAGTDAQQCTHAGTCEQVGAKCRTCECAVSPSGAGPFWYCFGLPQ